mmetsp:Transcript_46853/g.109412  ORF Transcript_46853/g.109412 Transcript_46853/m.109412 type:complete len:1049 (+) Transcript_46853:34-3180(+)
MVVLSATVEESIGNGIDLNANAFLLVHGWTAGALLLESADKLLPACRSAKTVSQLAAETGAKEGPLAILLRCCSALGYLDFNPVSRTYVAADGTELQELLSWLGPDSEASKHLRRIYAEAKPPFPIDSDSFTLCLDAWRDVRPGWKASKSKMLGILLDGIVLAPLLTSLTYNARWDEKGLDMGREKAFDNFDFRSLSKASREVVGGMFQELGVGSVDPEGVVSLAAKGALALQRVYSYYVPTSYSPLLSKVHEVLFSDPGWGFAGDLDPDDGEIHLDRTLNVVGSGAQHTTLFKDLLGHVHKVFDNDKFDTQPKFVIDTGCGDGHLLHTIYAHVRDRTARGKVLEDYPLTMIGVDFNEKARVATACNLEEHKVPHRVIAGDIGKPAALMTQLKRKKVDPSKALHVRSFLDHDRPYIAAKEPLKEDSAVAAFALAELADFVHLDKEGASIHPLELFASLVEHMARWADALQGSHGLCMLEVMQLDVLTTKRFLNDCVSFHFDIVQSLSRQYMVSAVSFAMSCAMAGLFPTDFKAVQAYPEQGRYCRMLNQHLVRKPYIIRLAELSDLPRLQTLEEKAWAPGLRASSEVLKTRLQMAPTGNFVCEVDGEVVAVLYTQRIPSVSAVDSQKFMDISASHDPKGRVLQLISISADADAKIVGVGSDLRSFALLLAKLDPTVDTVIGVTRCSNYSGDGSMAGYVAGHVQGKHADKTLGFHTGYGAHVARPVPGFRPEDEDNGGVGVLIQYDVKSWSWTSHTEITPSTNGVQKTPENAATALDKLREILTDMKHPVEDDQLGLGFFNLGVDSLEMVRIRNQLSTWAGRELSSTFLLDFPSVQEAAAELEKQKAKEGKHASALEVICQVMADMQHPLSDDQLTQGFFVLGIDSLEMIRIKNKLSQWLGEELPATFLLDYPSVRELATEVDKLVAKKQTGNSDAEAHTEPAILDVDLLLQAQEKLKKAYSLSQNQKKISALAAKHSDDKAAFTKALEPLLAEVEGSVLVSLGIIDDLQPVNLQKGRKLLALSIKRLRRKEEAAKNDQEVLGLVKLGD